MIKKRLPKGIRKYLRREKARLRKDVLDFKKQEEKIKALYQGLVKKGLKEYIENNER